MKKLRDYENRQYEEQEKDLRQKEQKSVRKKERETESILLFPGFLF